MRSTGEVDVAVEGINNSLQYHWNTGGGWYGEQVGSDFNAFSAPSMAVSSSGTASVAVQGNDNTLQYYSNPAGGSWSAPTSVALMQTTYGPPALSVRATGEVDIATPPSSGATPNYYSNSGGGWMYTAVP